MPEEFKDKWDWRTLLRVERPKTGEPCVVIFGVVNVETGARQIQEIPVESEPAARALLDKHVEAMKRVLAEMQEAIKRAEDSGPKGES